MTARPAKMLSIATPPAPRGRLIDAKQIQAKIGGSEPPSLDWIRANVPGRKKFSHRMVRWNEAEVDAWLYGGGT